MLKSVIFYTLPISIEHTPIVQIGVKLHPYQFKYQEYHPSYDDLQFIV